MSMKQKRVIIILMLLILSIVYTLPFFLTSGINHFEYQDTYFHLSRILGLSNVWKSPVNFNNFNHHGTMVNSFYPWLTVYPMYFIYKLTNNLVVSYKLFYFFVTFLTMIISYFSVYRMKRSNTTAFIFSLVYTFTTYRSVDIFKRASLGEALALSFLPLILLGCYMIFFKDYKKWYYLTIGMTLTMYTHLLSVVMVSVIIFFAFIISFNFWDQKIERLKKMISATLWTVVLSLWFIGPFIQQSKSYSLKVPAGRVLQGTKVSEFIINSLDNDMYTYTLGFFLLIFGMIVLLSAIREKECSIDKGIFLLGIFLVFISSSLFPWEFFSSTPISKIQFVWRLTAYSSLFIAYGVSLFISKKIEKHRLTSLLSILTLILLLHTSSVLNLYTQHEYSKITPETIVESAMNYDHTDYANKESINYPELISKNQFFLDNKLIYPKTTNTDSIYKIFVKNASDGAVLVTPIYRYLGQKIYVNDKRVSGKLSKFGTTEVSLKKGDSIIRIEYNYSSLAKISAVISFIALIIFVCIINLRRVRESELV